jgi:hypothetical protein
MVFIIENPQLMFFKWYFPNESAELRGFINPGLTLFLMLKIHGLHNYYINITIEHP